MKPCTGTWSPSIVSSFEHGFGQYPGYKVKLHVYGWSGALEGVGAAGAVGLNNLGVGVGNMLISKGKGTGVRAWTRGHFGKPTENFQGQTFRSLQECFWEILEMQSSEELMEAVRP
jgi:hypothetical protein